MSEVKLENQRSYGHGGIAIGVLAWMPLPEPYTEVTNA